MRVYTSAAGPVAFGVSCPELEGCGVEASGRFETN
jgi:hypothetical protein